MSAAGYEQRHYNPLIGKWSGWYRSSDKAYREHIAGPVKCFEVRPLSPEAPASSKEEGGA